MNPASRASTMPPQSTARAIAPRFAMPPNSTIRSLECWSIQGRAGDTLSDAYAARAALARGCRYGLNWFGRLVFVFLPDQGAAEYASQVGSTRMTATTRLDLGVTSTLCRMSRRL